MDGASLAVGWLSFAVTTIGLGSLITQASVINDQLDPFHANRNIEYLGIWFKRQNYFPWWRMVKSPPIGPVIAGKLTEGFCGRNVVHLSRIPFQSPPGKPGWAVLLSVLHPSPPRPQFSQSLNEAEKSSITVEVTADVPGKSYDEEAWLFLPNQPLVRHNGSACIQISRTTLITLLSITNARPIFRYSDAAGHRAAYASYCGQWYLEWPLGATARVHFAAHDSHTAATDVYPPSFEQRIDRCIQMTAGVISAQGFQCAFPGRKATGYFVLDYVPKGFPGAHGSRHLYNMMGGEVYEIDFLYARKSLPTNDRLTSDMVELELPSTEKGQTVTMLIPPKECVILNHALDCLPWNSLSWSVHRGLRDILIEFGKPVMDEYRFILAATLKQAVEDRPEWLEARGWHSSFIKENMGEMASASILAGGGNSGDVVRVVTDIAVLLTENATISRLDETVFWRSTHGGSRAEKLSVDAIIALTKYFLLEWSNEFDYQMYHDLPMKLFLG